MRRWLKYLFDPEWLNYFSYQWHRNPVIAVLTPLHLAWAGSWWVSRRFISRLQSHRSRRAIWNVVDSDSTRPLGERENGSSISSICGARPVHLVSCEDIPVIASYAHSNLKAQVEALVSSADNILANRFPLLSNIQQFPPDQIFWRGPFPDQEDLFYLNRWYHGVTLAKAFVYTGGEKYVVKFVELLKKWAIDNPANPKSPVWESYSVSERIVNWLFVHFLLQQSDFYRNNGQQLAHSLIAIHAEYLAEHLETRTIHNHLINNARALLEYGLLCPGQPKAANICQRAWTILTREIQRQFREDGMLGEQSTHYHLLLLSRYTEAVLLAQRKGYVVPEPLLVRLRQMYSVGNLFIRPDQSLALIGDVSPDADPSSLVGILAVGAAFFGVPSAVPPNEYALWFLGRQGLQHWSGVRPETGLYHLPYSGYAVYRSPQMHLVMHCDPQAEVIRHGHQDVLSLDLWAGGIPILSDSGNSSFAHDGWHQYFHGPRAHSTIVLDGLRPFIVTPVIKSLFRYPYGDLSARFTQVCEDNGTAVVEAEHSGYYRLPAGVAVRRTVKVFGKGLVSIHDHFEGYGRHLVEILYQFGQNRVEPGPEHGTLLVYGSGREPVATVKFNAPAEFAVELHKGQTRPIMAGWFSPSYGCRVKASLAVCSFQLTGPTHVETYIEIIGTPEAPGCAG